MSSTIKFEGTQKSKQWGMLSNEEINKVMDEYDQGQLPVSTTGTTTTTTTTTSTTTRTTNPKGQVRLFFSLSLYLCLSKMHIMWAQVNLLIVSEVRWNRIVER